ncbi:hypothetical protein H5410_021003, partial [Solanum commersonii]
MSFKRAHKLKGLVNLDGQEYSFSRSMKFNLISWNVGFLNGREKRRVVKSLIWDWKADIICFQETKLEGEIKEWINQIWGQRWVRYACLEASGTRGGISTMGQQMQERGNPADWCLHSTCKFE